MKAFEYDVVKHMERGQLRELPNGSVQFKVADSCYYTVSIDKDGESLKIYKSGFPDDRLLISIQSANIALIK